MSLNCEDFSRCYKIFLKMCLTLNFFPLFALYLSVCYWSQRLALANLTTLVICFHNCIGYRSKPCVKTHLEMCGVEVRLTWKGPWASLYMYYFPLFLGYLFNSWKNCHCEDDIRNRRWYWNSKVGPVRFSAKHPGDSEAIWKKVYYFLFY